MDLPRTQGRARLDMATGRNRSTPQFTTKDGSPPNSGTSKTGYGNRTESLNSSIHHQGWISPELRDEQDWIWQQDGIAQLLNSPPRMDLPRTQGRARLDMATGRNRSTPQFTTKDGSPPNSGTSKTGYGNRTESLNSSIHHQGWISPELRDEQDWIWQQDGIAQLLNSPPRMDLPRTQGRARLDMATGRNRSTPQFTTKDGSPPNSGTSKTGYGNRTESLNSSIHHQGWISPELRDEQDWIWQQDGITQLLNSPPRMDLPELSRPLSGGWRSETHAEMKTVDGFRQCWLSISTFGKNTQS